MKKWHFSRLYYRIAQELRSISDKVMIRGPKEPPPPEASAFVKLPPSLKLWRDKTAGQAGGTGPVEFPRGNPIQLGRPGFGPPRRGVLFINSDPWG
jgi:hypothetical protein